MEAWSLPPHEKKNSQWDAPYIVSQATPPTSPLLYPQTHTPWKTAIKRASSANPKISHWSSNRSIKSGRTPPPPWTRTKNVRKRSERRGEGDWVTEQRKDATVKQRQWCIKDRNNESRDVEVGRLVDLEKYESSCKNRKMTECAANGEKPKFTWTLEYARMCNSEIRQHLTDLLAIDFQHC